MEQFERPNQSECASTRSSRREPDASAFRLIKLTYYLAVPGYQLSWHNFAKAGSVGVRSLDLADAELVLGVPHLLAGGLVNLVLCVVSSGGNVIQAVPVENGDSETTGLQSGEFDHASSHHIVAMIITIEMRSNDNSEIRGIMCLRDG